MSEANFTPGPWRVEGGTTLIWGDCNPDDCSGYGFGYPIAECRLTPSASWAKGPQKYEEVESNAHLIAAAPDLYEACEAVFDAVDMTDKEQYAALKLVVKALAKARGEV